MARNPRRTPAPGYTSTIASVVLICISVALALLAQIRLKDELNRLDRDLSKLDRQITEQRKLNQKLVSDYQFLVSSSGLENRVREMRLSLVMPTEDARVILPEPISEPPVPAAVPPSVTPVPPASSRRSYATELAPTPAIPPVMARQRR
ncbi:MAG: hypothetical protein IT580_05400 [Verrucomicrobiales bacterium]|nr:hypothetical protein [Verrucomicrobiales bacterium]